MNHFASLITKKDIFLKLTVWFLLLNLFIIFTLPRIAGHFRGEDILTPILIFIDCTLLFRFANTNHLYKRFILSSIVYFTYSFFITCLNVFLNGLPIKAFLILGKEAQYFLIFYLMYTVFNLDRRYIKRTMDVVLVFSVVAVVVALFFVLFDIQDYYGIRFLNVYRSPSLSMLMYFNCAALCFLYSYCFKKKFFVLTIVLLLTVMLVGSRTGDIITIVFLLLWIYVCFMYKFSHRVAYCLLILFFVAISIVYNKQIYRIMYFNHIQKKVISASLSRMATLLTPLQTLVGARMNSWKSIAYASIDSTEPSLSNNTEASTSGIGLTCNSVTITNKKLLYLLFGRGRGSTHIDKQGNFHLGLGADNQYTKNLYELGVVGSLAFFYMLFSFCNYIKYPLKKFYLIYLFCYLLSGLSMETWQLSKGGQMFWIITAFFVSFSMNESCQSTS
jgi:hypothetical protein